MFKTEGRWVHQDENIYSEIELQYLCSSLAAMVNAPNYEEFNENEGITIIEKHWSKTVHTLEVLMNQMNMMYYFHKLRLQLEAYERPGKRPSLMALEKIMRRCFKLYQMIDGFMKVFKLVALKQKLELSADLGDAEVEDDDNKERKKQVLIKRISIAIVLLIKENPILPVSFKYEGQCLLEKLKAERDAYKRKRENEKR
jgi:hypothetical protein